MSQEIRESPRKDKMILKSPRKRILFQLAAAMVAAAMVAGVISAIRSEYRNTTARQSELQRSVENLATLALSAHAALLAGGNLQPLDDIHGAALDNQHVIAIAVHVGDRFLSGRAKDLQNYRISPGNLGQPFVIPSDRPDIRLLSHPIVRDGSVIGQFDLFYTDHFIRQEFERRRLDLLTTLLLTIVAGLVALLLVGKKILPRPSLQDLRHAIQASRSIFENAPVGMLQITPTGAILNANPAMAALLDYKSVEDLIGRTNQHGAGIFASKLREQEFLRLIDEHESLSNFEFEACRKDGRTIAIALSAQAIRREDGSVACFECVLRDISESQKVQAELNKISAYLHLALQSMPGGMVLFDEQLRYVAWTKKIAEWYGLPPGFVEIGKPYEDIVRFFAERGDFGPGDINTLVDNVMRPLREKKSVFQERQLPNGMTLEVHRNPLPNGGFVSIFMDITERKRTERELEQYRERLEIMVQERTEDLDKKNTALNNAVQELQHALNTLSQAKNQLVQSEKLAALGSLVAGVAHELNTPIGNTLLVASTLAEETHKLEKKFKEGLRHSVLETYIQESHAAMEIMLRSLNRAASLISSFKKIAIDQTSSRRRVFKLREVIDEILLTLHPILKKASCTVDIAVPEDIELDSFPGPLGQVITNLVDNAIVHAFSEREQGTIRFDARQFEGDMIELRCIDDGQGIAPEIQHRVCEPFFTTRLGKGGSGLGLSITSTIITGILGGSMQIDSKPGKGTTFTLTLPRVAPAESPSHKTAQP